MEKLKPKVYISYCWSEPSIGITRNWLCPSLKDANIDFVLDKNDCGYNDNIVEFEKKIGKGDFIIIVFGKDYFKSEGCMFEAACIFENGDPEHRVRIVNLNDYMRSFDFYSDVIKYWDEKHDKIDKLVNENKAPANYPFIKEQKMINKIISQTGKIWDHESSYNSLNFTELSKDNFSVLIESILSVSVEPFDLNKTEPNGNR